MTVERASLDPIETLRNDVKRFVFITVEGERAVVAVRTLGLMVGNALAYHIGLVLTLMGFEGGLGILMATTNLAMAYLLSKYVQGLQRSIPS